MRQVFKKELARRRKASRERYYSDVSCPSCDEDKDFYVHCNKKIVCRTCGDVFDIGRRKRVCQETKLTTVL